MSSLQTWLHLRNHCDNQRDIGLGRIFVFHGTIIMGKMDNAMGISMKLPIVQILVGTLVPISLFMALLVFKKEEDNKTR